jgi:hypothetical protein
MFVLCCLCMPLLARVLVFQGVLVCVVFWVGLVFALWCCGQDRPQHAQFGHVGRARFHYILYVGVGLVSRSRCASFHLGIGSPSTATQHGFETSGCSNCSNAALQLSDLAMLCSRLQGMLAS